MSKIFFLYIRSEIIVRVVSQWVWEVGSRPAGAVIQAGWDYGHEASDLWAKELEQLHLFEVGCLVSPTTICGSYLHPDAAVRHVDGTTEYAQELLVQGSCSI